ncbi:hypothetical protein GFS24_10405 [Chitinophaga sp. SYP-B3965]|uniref:hypothetical protein n=1 Tax=Chitinophaga sp. SYP-B3965 TaxID=2663120 RepID=UPI001299B9C2|nr:hypothetical protein [Chitinophaga sp. SYP-B3965]MRG45528.1 hypothetical protein [Chitinophaga sp. SYP-B3965]
MIYPRKFLFSCLCLGVLACNNNNSKQASSTSIPATEDTLAQMPGSGAKTSVSTDEQLFKTAFGSFKTAVEQNDEEQVKSKVNFPLPTSKDDVKGGELSARDFHSGYNHIFNADVRRLLPKAGDDNIAEVDTNNQEAYYQQLRQMADKDSKLFEVYTQFPEKNTNAESYFGFVFGKVKGEYKAVGYYSKWPVKN